jgi:2-isopropylmalate synthase
MVGFSLSPAMSRRIQIYDTTLRDGAQGEGISFSSADKIRIAERLDVFGIDYIEGGWPGSNPKDMDFFTEAATRKFKHAKVAAFGSTRRANTKCKDDPQIDMLVKANTPVVTLVGKTWSLHVTEVLRTTPEENLAMIGDSVRYFKDHGKEVVYDAEHFFDGYRDDPRYALATLKAAQDSGVDVVVLCDTNGGTMPGEVARVMADVVKQMKCAVGIHTHNDSGVGVANALAAIDAGAVQVQGTINGYGERTGNCNLTSVIPCLVLKMGYDCISKDNVRKLRDLSMFVDDLANVRHDIRQPFVGATAFAHKGGIHVNAIEKVARSYEHIDPETVGNHRRVLVSELSGRSNILMKAHELGMDLSKDTPEVRDILRQLKQLEHAGYEYEAADASFHILVQKLLKQHKPFFKPITYRVTTDGLWRGEGSPSSSSSSSDENRIEAVVKIEIDGQSIHEVADGDGPVNALDNALRKALKPSYPAIAQVRLVDYKVRILDSGSGTAAKTRVIIESTDGQDTWGTVGVHDNIIEASWEALVDSVEYKLFKDEKRK